MATEQELQALFNSLDRDEDGKVSLSELFLSPGLSAVLEAETDTRSPQALLAKHDTDKDGKLTFAELRQAVAEANNLTWQ
ncbi:EF-hand domain-containing protein [Leptolyngbya sp. FACHB-321]|uniref:EF-hand domain-containing protein n=1 Tax=Leptolyngbya sp. FACHB-321 TaxID=2692807 RepID=UPI0016841A18|nr:EF-hand domain-containing protein [Leptolyngbya sp. FACHB-321]MBD2034134.1 EF-hand domain-containing protein [Leptolyngbya sp. FACHB-321]